MVVGVNPIGRRIGYGGRHWKHVVDLSCKNLNVIDQLRLVSYLTIMFRKALLVARKLSLGVYSRLILTDLKFFSYGFGRFLIQLEIFNFSNATALSNRGYVKQLARATRRRRRNRFAKRIRFAGKHIKNIATIKRFNRYVFFLLRRRRKKLRRRRAMFKSGSKRKEPKKRGRERWFAPSKLRKFAGKDLKGYKRYNLKKKDRKRSKKIRVYRLPYHNYPYNRYGRYIQSGALLRKNLSLKHARKLALLQSLLTRKRLLRRRRTKKLVSIKLREARNKTVINTLNRFLRLKHKYDYFVDDRRKTHVSLSSKCFNFVKKRKKRLLKQRSVFFKFWAKYYNVFRNLKKLERHLDSNVEKSHTDSVKYHNRKYLLEKKILRLACILGLLELYDIRGEAVQDKKNRFINLLKYQIRLNRSANFYFNRTVKNNNDLKKDAKFERQIRKLFSVYEIQRFRLKRFLHKSKAQVARDRYMIKNRKKLELKGTTAIFNVRGLKLSQIPNRKIRFLRRSKKKISDIIFKRALPWWFLNPIKPLLVSPRKRKKSMLTEGLNKFKFNLDRLFFEYAVVSDQIQLKIFMYYLSKISGSAINDYMNEFFGSYNELDVHVSKTVNSKDFSTVYLLGWVVFKIKQGHPIKGLLHKFNKELKRSGRFVGWKFCYSGRLTRRSIATFSWEKHGKLPLGAANLHIEYAKQNLITRSGMVGLKLWTYRKKDTEKAINVG